MRCPLLSTSSPQCKLGWSEATCLLRMLISSRSLLLLLSSLQLTTTLTTITTATERFQSSTTLFSFLISYLNINLICIDYYGQFRGGNQEERSRAGCMTWPHRARAQGSPARSQRLWMRTSTRSPLSSSIKSPRGYILFSFAFAFHQFYYHEIFSKKFICLSASFVSDCAEEADAKEFVVRMPGPQLIMCCLRAWRGERANSELCSSCFLSCLASLLPLLSLINVIRCFVRHCLFHRKAIVRKRAKH